MKPYCLALILPLLLAACGDSGLAGSPPASSSSGSSSSSSSGSTSSSGGIVVPPPVVGPTGAVRFIALGDTGCGASPPCSSAGEAGNVAKVIEKVCAQRGCDFAVMAGDNIYEMGAIDTADPSFASAFRTPYANLNFPFLAALGNHDNSNSPIGEGLSNFKGDVQVAYHYAAANTGGKWVMPDRYYRYAVPQTGAPVLEFFVIDASPITHFGDDPSPQWSGATLQTYIAGQMSDLNDGLAASTAPWKFALAHHPYISNGQHGNAGEFDVDASPDPCSVPAISSSTCRGTAYKSFLENTICNKVDVFFAGHDHEMYWLMPTAACGKTEFILSGNGSKERASADQARNPVFFQADETYGFFWVEVQGNTLTSAAYKVHAGGAADSVDGMGNPLPAYERSFTRKP